MNAIPLINNIPKTNINNEKQLRQEINTSLVALKKEAGTLEGLINEAAQMLVTINNRIATLENDTVKKSDIVDVVQSGNMNPVTSDAVADKISSLDVSSVGGSGKYISAISETDGKINATATDLGNMVPVNSVTSGNMHSVTSGAVYDALITLKTVSRESTLLSGSTQLTSNGLSYTVTKKGIVKVTFCKVGQGYSLYLSRNNTQQDRFSFYQGNSNYNFGSLLCFVDVGDTIKIYSDGSYTNFYIQTIILQELEIR